MTAATLDFENDDRSTINHKKKINQQQIPTNKTRKQIRTSETFIDNDKVNSVLASIHKGFADEEDEDNDTRIRIEQPLQKKSTTFVNI